MDVADLQTGNVEAGKQYFNGAGGCANCHSPTGDLAGIASRYKGLELEEQMLYPEDAKSKVTVTLASGQTITGTLAYLDEFTVGLIDPAGTYRSWRTARREVQSRRAGGCPRGTVPQVHRCRHPQPDGVFANFALSAGCSLRRFVFGEVSDRYEFPEELHFFSPRAQLMAIATPRVVLAQGCGCANAAASAGR